MKKMKFKKISAILSGVLVAGLTIGSAAAASYPAPFVDDGVADVAIVYGTGAGVSSLDMVQAGNIQTSLGDYVEGETTVTGGETFTLEKSSDNFNFADELDDVYSDLDDDEMDFLADGTYDDGDVDVDYEQSIDLPAKALTLFADNDYNDDEPTMGFHWTSGEEVISYTIDFDDGVNYTEMVDTEMPLLGGDYYVLAASSSQIDVLDSAEKTTISEGETITVGGKTVSITFISADGVKLSVDGESTEQLEAGEYEELDDETYVVVTEVLYSSKEGTVGTAEISLGSGKIELINGEEIELNDEDVDGLYADFTADGSDLGAIKITWKSDKGIDGDLADTFLTEEDSISMPLFEAIQVVFGGMDYADDSEVISFDNGDTLTINMDNFDLPVAWYDDASAATFGEENNELILATSVANYTTPAANLTGGLDLEDGDRFIVVDLGTDLGDVETLYYEVSTVDNDSGDIEVVLDDLIGDDDITFDSLETQDEGSVTLQLVAMNDTGSTGDRAYINFTGSNTIYYNKVVSDKGLVIDLPTDAAYFTNGTGATFTLTEADKDEDLTEGRAFTLTVKNTTNDKLHVSDFNLSSSYAEETSDDNYISYVPSDLASIITTDESGDEYTFEIEYFGKEATAEVIVATGGEVSSSAGALGDVLVKDTEVSTVDDKNLVIVGGSCINSAAANVLGGAYCGAAFTEATGVGEGQFLIKGVQDVYTDGKLALVVAGYDAADTVNAATYLTKKDVDTSMEYKGTSATEATLMTETA